MIDNKVEQIKKHIEAISEILGIEKNESNENTPLNYKKCIDIPLYGEN